MNNFGTTTSPQKFLENLLPIFKSELNPSNFIKNIIVKDEIFEIKNFLNQKQCQALIDCSENYGYIKACFPAENSVKTKEIRDLQRVMIEDEKTANFLAITLEPFVPLTSEGGLFTGISERFRFLKYNIGNKYGIHKDGCMKKNHCEKSLLSFVIYLNDDIEGGITRFHENSFENGYIDVIPEIGKLLIYRQNWIVEEIEVTKGIKYCLRTDLFYKWFNTNQIKNFQPIKCGICLKEAKPKFLQYCDCIFFECGCSSFYSLSPVSKNYLKCQYCQKSLEFRKDQFTCLIF